MSVLMNVFARREFRKQARASGKGPLQIVRALRQWDTHTLEDAAAQVEGGYAALQPLVDMIPDNVTDEVSLGAIGDGEILKKIIEFFNSPIGQAIIQMLLAMLFAV